MKKFKGFVSLALSAVMVAGLAACGGTASSSSAASTAPSTGGSSTATSTAGGQALKIGIVTSSGVDDGNFGQDCYNGILEFIKTSPDSTVNHVKEPDIAKIVQAAEDIMADYDVMVLPGFQFSRIGAAAEANPDQKIILVDTPPSDAEGNTVELENVYSMTFKEQESGFFAGVAAALETKTNKVAVVNGQAFPSNVNYQFGFMAGVNYANAHFDTKAEYVELPSFSDKSVVTGENVGGNYIGSFSDASKGKNVGSALINEGVDIMLVAAGAAGNGVFTAAKEAKDVYVIGCDVDEFDSGANGDTNVVLTSVIKNMHANVTKQLEAIADGSFVGKNELLGAESDSTGFVSEPGRQQLSENTLAKLAEVYELVKNGTVVPPTEFEGTVTDFPGLK